jgi:hypothetical protein
MGLQYQFGSVARPELPVRLELLTRTVYIGPDNSATGLPLNGALYPTLNASVCYDGGFSGTSCYNTIDSYPAYGTGDSGRPVVAPSTGSGLNGIGIIAAIDTSREVPCPGRTGRERPELLDSCLLDVVA